MKHPPLFSILLFLLLLCAPALLAQHFGFEETVPKAFKADKKGKLTLSTLYYKEGSKSLEWRYRPGSTLRVTPEHPLAFGEQLKEHSGITLWIYNETPQQDSVRFEFLTPDGQVAYDFGFRLVSTGWRACWISFEHMRKLRATDKIDGFRLVAPQQKGRIFLDRLTFPVVKINDRTTPDRQMPTNNALSYRDLWHWCRVWQWEQYDYDILLDTALGPEETEELREIERRLTRLTRLSVAPQALINKARNIYRRARIRLSGNGFTGAPVVAPDELDRKKGELSWNDLDTMLSGFAYDACYNHSKTAREDYLLVWEYAIDQGFAYGSGMGTNHHYGYQVRNLYTTAWLMRDVIRRSPARDRILAALTFWAGLQETRRPCPYNRDELLDSWNTLLIPRVVAALLQPDDTRRARALKALSRWTATSLHYTPGTIGGIKVDGTAFHHGGFYPAYTSGALAAVGRLVSLLAHTRYEIPVEPRRVLRSALLSMRNYSNPYEWGIGLGGRHPYGGAMKILDVDAFASLALAGDLSEEGGDTIDRALAADYLRLCTRITRQALHFRQLGITSAPPPQGFFVYNYGAAGIHRRADWMVTLKGYNTDVWGAEIYTHDNRYGRYQSYGSVQIMGGASAKESGYDENGWDWNRLPGTTAIHLPFELLDSPLPGTTMAHSRENFAGSSSLQGRNGVFAMKLMEREYKNFTPDFVARKSVFCFDNRLVCLGTGIRNGNTLYHTETTLFQSLHDSTLSIRVQGEPQNCLGFSRQLIASDSVPVCLSDAYHNHYFVKEGTVNVRIASQQSRHDKTRELTRGDFASAWIDHGKAPADGSYEYLVVICPDTTAAPACDDTTTGSYEVHQRTDSAHIVFDRLTGITAYVVFEEVAPAGDSLFLRLPAETLIMRQHRDEEIVLSVCDPNLNISDKSYTTAQPSRIIHKQLLLKGMWNLSVSSEQVQVMHEDGNTRLIVSCQHGQPVEFKLKILLN